MTEAIGHTTKITVGLLIPIIGGLMVVLSDHYAVAELALKQAKIDSLTIDVAVIKAQVIDINRKLDKEFDDGR